MDSSSLPSRVGQEEIAGTTNWNNPTEFSYGISLSLYEEDKTQVTTETVNGISISKPTIVGEPVADVFGIQCGENYSIMAVADGVNWGKKSRLAARCAIRAVMEHFSSNMSQIETHPTSHTICQLLLEAVTCKAQEKILAEHGTLTTLTAAVVCEMDKPGEWALFTCAVGDSPAYVFYPRAQKVVEVTVGCHSHDGGRDMRLAGGALGPSLGSQPDLTNLTLAYMPVSPGDIVFLTTDGVSDNFTSSVLKGIVGEPLEAQSTTGKPQLKDCCNNVTYLTTVLSKHQEKLSRHLSAQTVTACLINHSVEVTEQKRLLRSHCIENNIDMRREMKSNPEFAARVNATPGKLDHATVVSFQVGHHRSSS